MLKILLYLLLGFLPISLHAAASQGELLERQFWGNIREGKWEEVEKSVAPWFQLALFDGTRNKEEYMSFAKKLNLSDFSMSNFIVTEGSDVIVMTYDVTVSETINNQKVFAKALRMSVWQKNQGVWQWIAHSILIPTLGAK